MRLAEVMSCNTASNYSALAVNVHANTRTVLTGGVEPGQAQQLLLGGLLQPQLEDGRPPRAHVFHVEGDVALFQREQWDLAVSVSVSQSIVGDLHLCDRMSRYKLIRHTMR